MPADLYEAMNPWIVSEKLCELCGGPMRKDNAYGVCTLTVACRKEYYRRLHGPSPRTTHINLLASIFALIPNLDQQVANEIASKLNKKERTEMLTRFYRVMLP